jgi:glycosyltransferase involved in cell wall biosynthesis/O-antigen/teichoic acid export membrane protein
VAATLFEPEPPGLIGEDGRPRGDFRRRAAKGSVVNGVYSVGVSFLGFLKGIVAAALLTAPEYGLWSLLAVTVVTLLWLAQVGIDDKYLQQDHPNQEHAFQLAFTLQAMLATFLAAVIAVGAVIASFAYGRPELLAPGLVLALGFPATALHTPQWVFYRRMDFVKQRLLQAVDPIASFVVLVPLALMGLGVWALVIATVASNWIAAAVSVKASPYPLRFRYESGTLREYATFSWPLMVNSGTAVATAQIPAVVVNDRLGLAAVGAIGLASQFVLFTTRVDDIVSNALYPAVCAVRDRAELLFESFSKSNRLALIWGVPAGVGVALFAGDIVHYILGEKWRFAVPLLTVMAISAAVSQIAFNWAIYFQAIGRTRPIAVHGFVYAAVFLGVGLPLLFEYGLAGYAAGALAAASACLIVRFVFLTRLFPGFRMLWHSLRAIAPTAPAVGAVLLLRALGVDSGEPAGAVAQAATFAIVVAVATYVAERSLLHETLGYLRPPRGPTEARGTRLRVAVPADRWRLDPRTGAGRVWHTTIDEIGRSDLVEPRPPGRLDGLRSLVSGRPDVWLIPGHEGAVDVSAPAVAVVHGSAWQLDDGLLETIPRAYAEPLIKSTEETIACADMVIVPSQYTRRGLTEGYGMDPHSVVTVPHGVDADVFHPERGGGRARVAEALGEERPYVLFASIPTIGQKNLAALREAVAGLAARGLPHALVIAGGPAGGETPEALAAVDAELDGAPGRVAWLGHLDDEALAGLMAECDAFCLPSLFESFGLTALEAMACGAPVVVSDRGALPEVVGDAAIVAEPTAAALEEALARVLTDPELATWLRGAGRARAETMTWAATAAGWRRVLATAAGLDGRRRAARPTPTRARRASG